MARLKSCPFKTAAQAATVLIALSVATVLTLLPCVAQTTPPAQPNSPKGQVIFSRSIDENGQTTNAPVTSPVLPAASAPGATDTERKAVTYTNLDLDVHLHPAAQQIAVRALLALRNDGSVPLTRIPLQISSSLNWESVRSVVPGSPSKEITFQVATVNSDADHTGQLHEAIVSLPQPLAPGQSIQLDVTYSGAIAASAQRLIAIGTPEAAALASDWDQVGVAFTGLRGFGNVLWYPDTSLPVLLGDGAQFFDEIGSHKLRLTGAHFRLRLAVEFPHGQPPTVALINGHSVPLVVTESNGLDQNEEVDGVATASLESATLASDAPSLFVAIRTAHPGANLTAWTTADDQVSVQFWATAAEAVTPFVESWLGKKPNASLTLLDLPDPQDAPFETGALLAAPLGESSADRLNGTLVHALTHAWIAAAEQPRPLWLNEGLATFLGTLWTEKQLGRTQALGTLEAGRAALALAEPESPGLSAGQPLKEAISPVYYRTKAAYVLWMLRDLVGDAALSTALRDSKSAPQFEKLIKAAAPQHDLSWFFADWVDADKGLPDLSIDGVFPSSASAGNWLVSVNVSNSGYAAAEVAVTARSDDKSVTQRLLVPARGKAVQRILIQGNPTEVEVNDGTVPETQASVHRTTLVAPVDNSDSFGHSKRQ